MTGDKGEEKTSNPRMLCIPCTSLPAKLDPVCQVLVVSFEFCEGYERNRINKGEEYARVAASEKSISFS